MANDIDRIVIVGGGLAAAKAAEAVRGEGFDGSLHLLAEEPHRPYERPPLSKGVLLGTATLDETEVHEEQWYRDHHVELVTSEPVVKLDRLNREVVTATGTRHPYDRVILATGAAPRQLPVTGADLEGVHHLRTRDDAARIDALARTTTHVTVVGAGWIGSEVTAALRHRGVEVTMVDPLELPLVRVLGPEVARVFHDLHLGHGVDLRLGAAVEALHGDGHVRAVTLDDGTTLETDGVVVGIGISPRDELARTSGIAVNDGILVDQTLHTNDIAVLAAGDVARASHPRYPDPIRVEHWANALHQGTVAGRNAVGAQQVYDRLPYFFSDQYDLGMEYSGHAPTWDQVIVRGDLDSQQFIAFWVDGGRVVAAMNCNVWDVTDDLQALIRSRATVHADRLRDPDVPLAELGAADARRA